MICVGCMTASHLHLQCGSPGSAAMMSEGCSWSQLQISQIQYWDKELYKMLKIVKPCSLFFRLITMVRACSFSQNGSGDDKNRISSLRVKSQLFKELRQPISMALLLKSQLQKGFHDQSVIQSVCLEVLKLRYNPRIWADSKYVTFMVQKIADNQRLGVGTVSLGCALISIAQQSAFLNEHTIQTLLNRVSGYLKQQQKISLGNIINFLWAAYARPSNMAMIKQIIDIILSRKKELTSANWQILLKILNQRRFLTESEQQLLRELSKKINKELDQMPLTKLITFYQHLSHQNMRIWKLSNQVKEVERKIFANFVKLGPREIFMVIGYRSYFNRWSQYMVQDAIDSIKIEGKSREDDIFILRVLYRMIDGSQDCLLTEDQQKKVLELFERNIDQKGVIVPLINKNILNQANQLKLINMIQNSFYRQDYYFSPTYALVLAQNNISADISYEYLLQFSTSQCKNRYININFMSIAIAIHLMLWKFPKNQSYQQMHQQIKSYIQKNNEEILKFHRPKFRSRDILYEKFINFYRQCFESEIKSYIQTYLTKVDTIIPQFIVFHLIKTNDIPKLNQLMQKNKRMVEVISSLLEQSRFFPQKFMGSYNIIFELLTQQLSSSSCTQNLRQKIKQYLCYWEIHVLLTTDEARVFLKAVWQVTQKLTIRKNKSFFSYIVNTPSESIRQSKSYFDLLDILQNRLADPDYDEANLNYDLLIQLIKLNIVSQQFAKDMLIFNTEVTGTVRQYLKIVYGKGAQIDKSKFQYNSNNLILLVKNKKIDSQYLTRYMDQILNLIPGCDAEEILLNFQMKPNKESALILEKLVDQYLQNFEKKFKRSGRGFCVASHLRAFHIEIRNRDKLIQIVTQSGERIKDKMNFYVQFKLRCRQKSK